MRSILLAAFLLLSFTGMKAQKLNSFILKDLNNKVQNFEELRGEKLTLIDFWTSWCKPCKKAIKELNKINNDYHSKGVKIIGINCDGPRSVSKVKPLSKVLKINYPILLDMDSGLMKDMNLTSFPSLIIVDGKGKVLWIHEGFNSGDEQIIRNTLDELLD